MTEERPPMIGRTGVIVIGVVALLFLITLSGGRIQIAWPFVILATPALLLYYLKKNRGDGA